GRGIRDRDRNSSGGRNIGRGYRCIQPGCVEEGRRTLVCVPKHPRAFYKILSVDLEGEGRGAKGSRGRIQRGHARDRIPYKKRKLLISFSRRRVMIGSRHREFEIPAVSRITCQFSGWVQGDSVRQQT